MHTRENRRTDQDSRNKTAGIGQSGWGNRDRTVGKGQIGKESENMSAGKGQWETGELGRRILNQDRIGQLERTVGQDSQNRQEIEIGRP